MASTPTDEQISALRALLTNESTPLARRFRALFSLKHVASGGSDADFPASSSSAAASAVDAIAAGFASPSALLKHELAYCLGQTGNRGAAAPVLRAVLEDRAQDEMCRHEAAEALGALGAEEALPLLRATRDDGEREGRVVRETCELAVERIEWLARRRDETGEGEGKKSDFASVDPAPPTLGSRDIGALETTLLDTRQPLFARYRAMFALRDLASPPGLATAVPAVEALARGLASDPSALFRHEIAFVFGQLSHRASIPALVAALSNTGEEGMVRHEAAEALGSLAGAEDGVEEVLRGFLADPETVVRESVVVALDMAAFERSGEVEYAIIPEAREKVAAGA